METKQRITEHIKQAILKMAYEDKTGRMCINLGNCRLDFSKTYYLNGFTDKTVKLSWVNGDKEIKAQGRIEDREEYYSFYTEGWSYIEHIQKESK